MILKRIGKHKHVRLLFQSPDTVLEIVADKDSMMYYKLSLIFNSYTGDFKLMPGHKVVVFYAESIQDILPEGVYSFNIHTQWHVANCYACFSHKTIITGSLSWNKNPYRRVMMPHQILITYNKNNATH